MLVSGLLSYSNLSPLNKIYKKIENKNVVSQADSTNSTETTQSDKVEETIIKMAKKDAAEGVYMGSEYAAFQRECIKQVSPNRSLAIAQVSGLMKNRNQCYDSFNRWVAQLLDLPYKVEVENGPTSFWDTAQVYDQNGEMIAAYDYNGWTSVPTSAEVAKAHELTSVYYSAYHEARQSMKTGDASGTLFNVQA